MSENTSMVVHGEVLDDPRDAEIQQLEGDVKRLRRELAIANGEIAKAKSEATRGLGALRKQLSPLYRALQQVFGELDAMGADDGNSTPSPTDGRTTAIWDGWKRRMGAAAPVIDALLLQPGMNQTQIGIAIGRSRKTVPALIFKLKTAGLITKDGDRYSLKQL